MAAHCLGLVKVWGTRVCRGNEVLRKKVRRRRGGGRDSIKSSARAFPSSLVKEAKPGIGLAYKT